MKKLLIIIISFSMLFLLSSCKEPPGLGIDVEDTVSSKDESATSSSQVAVTTDTDAAVTTKSSTESTTKNIDLSTTITVTKSIIPSGTKVEVTTGTDGKPVDSSLEGALGKILNSDKYTMQFEMQTEQNGTLETVPITAYVSGKKTALKTSMAMGAEKLEVTMLSTGTDFYLIIPTMKGYAKLPAADFQDMFPNVINKNDENVKYLGTTKVKYKGADYVCETYSNGESTTKYYFIAGELKRIEIVNKDGTTSILENIVYSNTVEDSIFTVPKGYLDLTTLLAGLS
ncbi:MAG: hypothetical protein WCN92_02490 [Eubacteriales bacterium]